MKKLSQTIAVLAGILLILLPLVARAESDSSRINRERKAIGRALVEVQSGDWPSVLPYYAPDIEYHDPIVTIEGIDTMGAFLAMLFGSSPDLVTTVEDEICINDMYTAAWTMVGFFNEVPYTAKGMSIMKFRPGETQVFYQRDYYTEGDIMINIPGLDEPTEAFRTYYRCFVDPTFDCPLGKDGAEDRAAMEAPPASGTFQLGQNTPNPFNPATTISYTVPDAGGVVTLRIYDVAGRLVRSLVDGFEPAGEHAVAWDGRNDRGRAVASGIYHYRLTGPGYAGQKRMVLLR